MRNALLAVGLLGVLAGAWAVHTFSPRRTPRGQPALRILKQGGEENFAAHFNEEAGKYRVVALLSPT